MGGSYPQFTCPNCRAITDLEAELEVDDGDEWMRNREDSAQVAEISTANAIDAAQAMQNGNDTAHAGGAAEGYEDTGDVDLTDTQFDNHADETVMTPQLTPDVVQSGGPTTSHAEASPTANGIEILRPTNSADLAPIGPNPAGGAMRTSTPTSAEIIGGEGPMTPRNNAGPFVLDGSAGRASVETSANAPGNSGSRAGATTVMDQSE